MLRNTTSILVALLLLTDNANSVQLETKEHLQAQYLGGIDSGIFGIYHPSTTNFDLMEWFNFIKDNFIAIQSMV